MVSDRQRDGCQRDLNSCEIRDEIYKQIAEEIERNELKKSTAMRAVAECKGDKELAQSIYVNYRFEELSKEYLEKKKDEARKKEEQENSDAEAQHKLGLAYYNGDGVEKNYAEAVRWWRKAAEQGSLKAQYNLGTC